MLEKMAAAAGGVTNHRMGLYDAVLIKNNHIAAAGGVRAALERAHDAGLPVEIEVRTRAELDEALACGATHLLLDNLTPAGGRRVDSLRSAAAPRSSSPAASRSKTCAPTRKPARISSPCGAITHSAAAVDINFRLEL